MGCATSMVKYLLFLFNLAFVIASVAFIAVGVLFKVNIDEYTEAIENVDSHFGLAPLLMIIVGVVVFIIAFFGCCGAIREGTCMLTTYAIILLTIFILQVALGVFAFIQIKDSDLGIKEEIKNDLKATMTKYDKEDVAREAIDSLQYGLECCGVDGPDDWRQTWGNDSAPSSCCSNKPSNCNQGAAFQKGCATKLFDFLKDSLKTVGIVVIVIGAIEIVGLVFISIGAMYKFEINAYTETFEKLHVHLSLAPTLMICGGFVVFLINFVGGCGAIMEDICVLATYAIMLLTLLCIQIFLGSYAIIQARESDKDVVNATGRQLENMYRKYRTDFVAQEAADALQFTLKCCGVNGPTDWEIYWAEPTTTTESTTTTTVETTTFTGTTTSWRTTTTKPTTTTKKPTTASTSPEPTIPDWTNNSVPVPYSCCENKISNCTTFSAFQTGCVLNLLDFIEETILIIGIVSIATALIELVGFITAVCLAKALFNRVESSDSDDEDASD